MRDDLLVPSLLHGLESRFLLITWSWCNAIAQESLGWNQPGRLSRKKNEIVNAHGALMGRKLLPQFFFSWLLMTEHLARTFDEGVIRKARLDETMLWGGGQLLYDLFATGCVRGPYAMPWDNTQRFRDGVLKPVVSLMRSYEHDDSLIFPPEAKKLLELRGLTFDF